jgi:hypothetical protein
MDLNTPERRAAWRRANGIPEEIVDQATLARIARILIHGRARSRGSVTAKRRAKSRAGPP